MYIYIHIYVGEKLAAIGAQEDCGWSTVAKTKVKAVVDDTSRQVRLIYLLSHSNFCVYICHKNTNIHI
jgi:hypothetical protein